ncbi:hypothetical protein [Amycolatopsis tolypomycina]|uniref:hypothetical protein n=1 Tax=Amycolatopsis tolypomycina TaxID=208445 RepID=UPI000B012F6D|nr:hypothetical protein [Amycolatopsis tolypomycina]
MTEGGFPAYGRFADNGLAEPAAGGVVVRAGTENGLVRVGVRVLAEPPATVETVGWEEVVDLSWHAERGSAGVSGHRGRVTTPPWPGDYRVRVHAYGRDDPETENHDLWIWTAPPEPPRVHARADRLGHRLRGEPEPPVVARPEAAHRWIGRSRLAVAATVTVATRPVRRGGHPWSRSRKTAPSAPARPCSPPRPAPAGRRACSGTSTP